jgi:hypothetical protein
MDIHMSLKPFMSEQYALEQNFLRMPVLFVYENRERSFAFNITDGLPIIGKIDIETRQLRYHIGNNCSIEQLSDFIDGLMRKIPSSITFDENEDSINSIEYDPSEEVWRHKTGSKTMSLGSTLTIKITNDTLKQFTDTLESYRKFAFMQIEGHKRLYE